MRIELTRSGGFAGITRHHEIETAKLDAAERREIEQLVAWAIAQPPSREASPDAFEYEITIDGKRYVATDAQEAWRELIDRITS
jgi:hypothetical protein